jgi:signal transduction histidine kinase
VLVTLLDKATAAGNLVLVELERTGEKLSIIVADDGPGVPLRDRLFKPFVTAAPAAPGWGWQLSRV